MNLLKIKVTGVEYAIQFYELHEFIRNSNSPFAHLEYVSLEKWKELLANTRFAFGAFDDDKFIGFFIGFPSEYFKISEPPDTVGKYLKKKYFIQEKRKFVQGDLWAIDPSYRGHGLGKNLLAHAFNEAKKLGYPELLAGILHAPIRNEASIRINKSLDAFCIEEIEKVGYVYGIYKTDLLTWSLEDYKSYLLR